MCGDLSDLLLLALRKSPALRDVADCEQLRAFTLSAGARGLGSSRNSSGTNQRQNKAGMETARLKGKVLGRPAVKLDRARALELHQAGNGVAKIAMALSADGQKVSRETVRRVLLRVQPVQPGQPARLRSRSSSPKAGR